MKFGKSGIALLILFFCLTACSKENVPNRLTNLKGFVTQDNLVYHIESIERLKNIEAYDKTLFEQHTAVSQDYDQQGNVINGKTLLVVKVSIDNKSQKTASLYVNGIELYKVDQQMKVDMKSRSEMEYFNRPQKSVKEFYKADIASNTKENYKFGYFVDDSILDDSALCMVINPIGHQLDDKSVNFLYLNK